MTRIPIVIDTDPGVDDFFCLAIGAAYPEKLDLKAVTAMGGNHYTDVTTQNALNILHLFGRDDVPVARGADRYLAAEFAEPVVDHHGENGVGGLLLKQAPGKPDPLPAWEKIREMAAAYPGELVLVTVAPLTNVGMALQMYPEIASRIKKIVMMGGTIEKGNMSPYAEANVGHNPEAAKIVFESGIPVDMVGLHLTLRCPLPRDTFDKMAVNCREEMRSAMQKLIDFRKGEPMHDSIAIASLANEEMITWKRGTVSVITEDPIHRGQTVFTENENGNCRVSVSVDLDAYYEVIEKVLLTCTA